jgi:hypothetical protein
MVALSCFAPDHCSAFAAGFPARISLICDYGVGVTFDPAE